MGSAFKGLAHSMGTTVLLLRTPRKTQIRLKSWKVSGCLLIVLRDSGKLGCLLNVFWPDPTPKSTRFWTTFRAFPP